MCYSANPFVTFHLIDVSLKLVESELNGPQESNLEESESEDDLDDITLPNSTTNGIYPYHFEIAIPK